MDVVAAWLLGFGLFFLSTAATVWWSNGNKTFAKAAAYGGSVILFAAAVAQSAQVLYFSDDRARPRPWIGLGAVEVLSIAAGHPFHSILQFVNTGQEAATDVRIFVLFMTLPSDTPEPPIPHIPEGTAKTVMVPTKGIRADLNSGSNVTDEEGRGIENGSLILWVVGKVEYGDRSGASYELPFRLRYIPRARTFGPF